ncbi:MAG: response regulator transcription factor [Myxococcota bacterium]
MKVLVADDDAVQQKLMERKLSEWGFDFVTVSDGTAAWDYMRHSEEPLIALLDWVMPGFQGPELCQRARALLPESRIHLILLTSRDEQADVVEGLQAGADDYVCKPFHSGELRARLHTGQRLLELRESLRDRVEELSKALEDIRQLRKLLPICSYCKRVRHDEVYWTRVESYLSERLDMRFSHGICPSCFDSLAAQEGFSEDSQGP